MAYDPSVGGAGGTIYLLLTPSRETSSTGFRLWTSTDKGQTFGAKNMDVPGNIAPGLTYADKTAIAVNNWQGTANAHYLYVAGKSISTNGLWAAASTDGGTTWTNYSILDTDGYGAALAIAPDGTVYLFWVRSQYISPEYTNILRYAWLATNGVWSGASNFGGYLKVGGINATLGNASPLRSNSASNYDWFVDNAFPHAAVANGYVYVTYADIPTNAPATDHGDIYLAEAAITNATHILGPPLIKRVNNDNTFTDQWDPAIAINPAGTELFIGYYSRQNDPVNNSRIMAYGAKAYITNGLANATFDCFPVSPTDFPPLFAAPYPHPFDGQFDPVFPQDYVCLDTDAVVVGSGMGCQAYINTGLSGICNFLCDDYTWADADNSYFYYAWCDRSRTWTWTLGGVQYTRPDADVKFARILQ